MFTITRRYTFSAAHRLEGHPKCGRLHGHNYVVEVALDCDVLEDSMIIDYGAMDEIIKPIVDAFDHRYIVSRENRDAADPYAEIALRNGDAVDLPSQRSTAECLAKYLFDLISPTSRWAGNESFVGVHICYVRVDETEKSTATYNG